MGPSEDRCFPGHCLPASEVSSFSREQGSGLSNGRRLRCSALSRSPSLQEAGAAALGRAGSSSPSPTRHLSPGSSQPHRILPVSTDNFRQSLGQRAAGPGGEGTSEHTRALHLGLVTDTLLCVQGCLIPRTLGVAPVELLWSLRSPTHAMKMIVASFQDGGISEKMNVNC